MRDALGTRSLRRLQIAWAASSLGGWTFFIALAVYAYGVGGATAVGVAAVVRMAPAALAAPAMSMLGDRHSRRNVLLVLALARAAVLAAAAAVVSADGPPALVFALAAAFTAIGTGHKPAQAALLPSLADEPRQLAAANAVWSTVDSVGFLIGAALGGVLVAAGGAELALSVTAIAFVAAGAALLGIPADRRESEPAPPLPGGRRAAEIAEGFRAVGADTRLRLVVVVLGVSTLVEGAIDVLVVLIAIELLSLGDPGVGWLNAAWGVGGVIGGAGAAILVTRGRNATALVVSGLAIGLPLIALTFAPEIGVAFAGLVVLGVGYAVIEVAGLTLVQRLASDAVLARAFGVVEGTYWLTTGVGSLLAPVLVLALDLRGALLFVGLVLPALLLARWRALARLEASAPVPEEEYRLLRALPMFAPLPVARLEELAMRVTHERRPAGDTIIREGEPGDRFYVIAEGEVDVTERGRFRRTEPAGDCFGEIALLREVPRTATVVSRTDVDLLVLERDEFLAAITGDRRALAAGEDLIEQRLAPV
ncbi:MAG TPA: cyclic nucleotide-binding domain-containing protein [Solirubrobacter sp.]|nr:cyclic nucleotide-binding domain-containing protein [Solirubrobacter sp.]